LASVAVFSGSPIKLVSIPGFAIAHGRLAPGNAFPPAIAEPGRGPAVPIKGSTNDHNGSARPPPVEAVDTSDSDSSIVTKKRSRDSEGCRTPNISKRIIARAGVKVA
jgi:hypothetical protein